MTQRRVSVAAVKFVIETPIKPITVPALRVTACVRWPREGDAFMVEEGDGECRKEARSTKNGEHGVTR